MNAVHIERLQASDVDALHILEQQCFTIPWSRQSLWEDVVQNPCALYAGAFCDDQLIGYAGIWHILDEGHITNVAVTPRYRKQGVGRLLMQTLIYWMEQRDVHSITLEVRPSNSAALALYRAFGFTEQGRRKGYYPDTGEDALILWRTADCNKEAK